jgi:hypothetical protein
MMFRKSYAPDDTDGQPRVQFQIYNGTETDYNQPLHLRFTGMSPNSWRLVQTGGTEGFSPASTNDPYVELEFNWPPFGITAGALIYLDFRGMLAPSETYENTSILRVELERKWAPSDSVEVLTAQTQLIWGRPA